MEVTCNRYKLGVTSKYIATRRKLKLSRMDAGNVGANSGRQDTPEDAVGCKVLPTFYLTPGGWGYIRPWSLIGPNDYSISGKII